MWAMRCWSRRANKGSQAVPPAWAAQLRPQWERGVWETAAFQGESGGCRGFALTCAFEHLRDLCACLMKMNIDLRCTTRCSDLDTHSVFSTHTAVKLIKISTHIVTLLCVCDESVFICSVSKCPVFSTGLLSSVIILYRSLDLSILSNCSFLPCDQHLISTPLGPQ